MDWYTGNIYRAKTIALTGEFEATLKGLYHPVARAVDLHASFLPGFPAYSFTRDITDGEGNILIPGTEPQTVERIQQLMKWSRWSEYGPLHNMNFTLKGRGILSLSNREGIDPTRPVVIEVRDPANTVLVFPDKWSKFPSLMITVITGYTPPDREEPGEYAQVYTPTDVFTFFEGEPYSYTDPITGLEIVSAQAPNEWGFVPAVESRFRDIGNNVTQNAFSTVVPLLATVNRMATYIMGVMGQYFKPQVFVAGAERGDEDIDWGDGIMYAPEGAEAKMLIAELDLAGATTFVKSVYDEVKANLPELIFDSIRGINRISTEGLELQFAELISKLTVSRASQDRALNDIFRAGLWAAQEAGMEGFDGYLDPEDPKYEDVPIELDPLRGFVPLGESALLAIQKQRLDVEETAYKLEQMRLEGELRLEQMQANIDNAGASAPPGTNSSASNNTAKPNPRSAGPDATSPGPKQSANDGQPKER
jgi:hypothetical protein